MLWYAAAAVVVVAVGLTIFLTMMQAEVIDSIAVLPPRDLSNASEDENLSFGIHEGLISELQTIGALKTICRQSVMQFKTTSKSPAEMAKELGGVKAFVEPTFLHVGNKLQVNAQLIKASDGSVLGTYKLEKNMEDVFALYGEIAQTIVSRMKVDVTPQERHGLATRSTVDPEVYNTTLKGKVTIEYATREAQIRQGIELFQKAIDRDPTYAPAWAGLGNALWSLAALGSEYVAPAEVREKAIAAAAKALQLDPNLPEAHKACAMIAIDGEWDLAKAQLHFEKAIELRPGYAAAHDNYGAMLSRQPIPRFDEARKHFEQSRKLDPVSPWNDISMVAWWLFQGKFKEALDEARQARQRDPTQWILPWQMGFVSLLLGRPAEAVPEFEAALKLQSPDRPAAILAHLGLAYGLAGRRADALKILTEMQEASKKRYISPYYLAAVYSGLGRMDEAFRLVDQALEQRTPWLVVCTPYDPLSVALRHDSRWKLFIDRLRKLVRLPEGSPDPYQ